MLEAMRGILIKLPAVVLTLQIRSGRACLAFIGILCSRLLHLDVSCSSLGLGALVLHEASHLR